MDRFEGILRWISTLFRNRRFEEELTEELDLHLEMAVAGLIDRGMDPEEARRTARRDFGGVERTREQVRERGRLLSLENLIRDIRYALRSLARRPLFTVSLILTLGVGIGCVMAMLGLMHAVLLRPLPYPDSHELVFAETTLGGQVARGFSSGPDFIDYRDQCEGFVFLSAIMPFGETCTVTGGSEPERIVGTAISPKLFATLGIQPVHGRLFSAEESAADAPEAVIISHDFWNRYFAADAGAVGSVLTIDGVGRTIVGIMPPEFEIGFVDYAGEFDFWRPMRPDRDVADLRDRHNWFLIGRLAEGYSLSQVQAQVDVVAARLAEAYPESNTYDDMPMGLHLVSLHEYFTSEYRSGFLILLAATSLLFLIAGANVTGLLLTRDHSRREELAVRRSLGASRGRLLSQLFAERILAAIAAGLLGAVLILCLQPVILQFYPINIPGVGVSGLSPMIALVTLVLAVLTAVVAGFVPALRCTADDPGASLMMGGQRITAGRSGFRRGLIFAQIALTVTLLISSGLLIRSLTGLMRVELGFNPENVLTAELELPFARYPEPTTRTAFFNEVLDRVRLASGVESAAMINLLPIRDPRNWFKVSPEGNPDPYQEIMLRSVTPDYFHTMQIPLLRGRPIQSQDTRETPRCVLSRPLAECLFPESDPIGGRVSLDYFGQAWSMEVVGVAGDVRIEGLTSEPGVVLWAAYPALAYTRMTAVIRTSGETSAAMTALREAVREQDHDIPISRVAMMGDLIADSVSERRTMTIILTLYSIIPLFLAAVGLYGLLAYVVRQRFREIGVRVALGAAPGAIVSLILRQGLWLVGLGLLVGSAGALGVTQLIRNQLFGVGPTDPVTFLGVGVVVAVVALAACLIPTLQAVRIDPSTALRVE